MIKIANPVVTRSDIKAVTKILQENQLSGRSPICATLEKNFAKVHKVKEAIAVNSGTSALFLALKALKVGVGDEVIIPEYAFIAVANAVTHTGATPKMFPVEHDTFNLDATKIEITKKTKAIILVHTYGHPANIDEFKKFGLPIIEDCAEALGAKYKGKMVGGLGTIGTFSFFANKTITGGEGGMVTTNDSELAYEIRKLKDQYRGEIQFQHDGVGYGMSLGAMQCALINNQLKRLKSLVKENRETAKFYTKKLQKYDNFMGFSLPREKDYAYHSYWMYTIKQDTGLRDYLHENGIETRPGFVPIYLQKPYYEGGRNHFDNIISIPLSNLTQKEKNKIVKTIKNFLEDRLFDYKYEINNGII